MSYKIEVEYNEYECGGYCTPSGCVGHEDRGLPIGFSINNVIFYTEDHCDGGEISDKRRDTIRETVEWIEGLIRD